FLRSIVSRSFSYNTAAGPTSWLICDTRVQEAVEESVGRRKRLPHKSADVGQTLSSVNRAIPAIRRFRETVCREAICRRRAGGRGAGAAAGPTGCADSQNQVFRQQAG